MRLLMHHCDFIRPRNDGRRPERTSNGGNGDLDLLDFTSTMFSLNSIVEAGALFDHGRKSETFKLYAYVWMMIAWLGRPG